ncbi:MAG: MFS transporter [Solirubrobacteraceae bacterium]
MVQGSAGAQAGGGASLRRRLLLVISAVVFIDTMFYAVITPLLPELSHQVGLSKLSAGVLTASYAAGNLAAALPGGALAVRRGPRFTVCVGLTLMVASIVAFGWLDSAWSLDLARFVEGVGGACSWAGGMAWIVGATPVAQRGAVIGRVLGAAIGGALFGPAIGAIASATGRAALFTGLGLAALALVAIVTTLPEELESSEQGVGSVIRVMLRPPMLRGMWLMVLPAMVSGALNVLGPLQLHVFGAGAGVIGAIFLLAAAVEAGLSPVAGRVSDRRGRMLPLRAGLAALAATLVCFTLPGTALELGLLIILICVVLAVFWAPAMAQMSDLAERYEIDQAHAAALMNLAWAAGQIVGSACGGATAGAFGDLFPTAVAAGLCLLSFVLLSFTAGTRSTA